MTSLLKIGNNQKGAATWLAKGLKIQEAQIALGRDIKGIGPRATDLKKLAVVRRAERLSNDISAFLSEAPAYLTAGYDDDRPTESSDRESQPDNMQPDDEFIDQRPEETVLPLPSNLGLEKCKCLGAEGLASLELELRAGQANDALHEIRLALADKAVLFRTDVRHSKSQAMSTRAWGKVHAVEAIVTRHSDIYRACRSAMMALGAGTDVMERYQLLRDKDLRVSSAVALPNARDHRNASLAWFWTMDIPRDTETNDWMSECTCRTMSDRVTNIYQQLKVYRVNWLRAKATRDRRKEEEELLMAEFQWTTDFFDRKARIWEHLRSRSNTKGYRGQACYAARQMATYGRLRDQCQTEWDKVRASAARTQNVDIGTSIAI